MNNIHNPIPQSEIDKYSVYRCNLCGKIQIRESKKKWMTSYCVYKGKMARLYKVKEEQQ